jgi:Ca-activated chloride channel homolog
LTVHIIGYRVENYSWTGEQSIGEAKCLAERNNGLYVTARSQEDLVTALEKTLDCPMISQRTDQVPSRVK